MFIEQGFPYIQRHLTSTETVPDYIFETRGMQELGKVLTLMKTDYYPSFFDKASYVICSIAASQYFSNGNKRLSIVALLLFLMANDVEVLNLTQNDFKGLLGGIFPLSIWEENHSIPDDHRLFLYNLAVSLGDRKKWGINDFGIMRQNVAEIFSILYRISNRPLN